MTLARLLSSHPLCWTLVQQTPEMQASQVNQGPEASKSHVSVTCANQNSKPCWKSGICWDKSSSFFLLTSSWALLALGCFDWWEDDNLVAKDLNCVCFGDTSSTSLDGSPSFLLNSSTVCVADMEAVALRMDFSASFKSSSWTPSSECSMSVSQPQSLHSRSAFILFAN